MIDISGLYRGLDLRASIEEAYRMLNRIYKPIAQQFGLGVVAFHMLMELYRADGRSGTDLAMAVGQTTTAYTTYVDELVKAGYAVRSPSMSDRRKKLIMLTPKGRETQAKVEEIVSQLHVLYRDAVPQDIYDDMMAGLTRVGNLHQWKENN